MAAFHHFRDINDITLKPRLLHSLLKEHLPDDKKQSSFQHPSQLPSIISTLKTHQLLYEEIPNSSVHKHTSSWTSAIDAWVDRILLLVKSNLPDRCWVGICLLGVTCSECSPQRFLASYSDWFNVLISHIQPSGVSQFVKVASCAAISDLLARLGGFSNIKRDGTSHASKLVQPILKMLNEDGNEAVLEVAAHSLSTILTYFPSAVLRHHDNVEGAIVSKIMSGSCSAKSLKMLASCLGSLPKSKGDEESWSLMMQKILLSVSSLLNDALEGLEEESRRDEAIRLLIPPGKDRPPSLGGQKMAGEASIKVERSQQGLMSTIYSLLESCCTMLTSSYPVQVAVPVRPLLAIIRRVLIVNGSLPETLQAFTTVMQQEYVCSQLPLLQLYVLDVLVALVNGIRSQLLPYAADIVRILMGYLKRCRLPELRTKAYAIIRVLLISMGSGLALFISQELINNGYIDLNAADSGSRVVAVSEESILEATLQCHPKKRKHASAAGPSAEQHASYHSEVKASKECPTSVALKKAAVEALEALLVVGGALKSDGWRRRIDQLLIEVATDACRGLLEHDGKLLLRKEPCEDFQLVALHALLASLLSPSGVRPLYLAQGLELFRKGKQSTGTKVAEFCAQALLALEVLVHPRALPLIDTTLANGNGYSIGRTDFGSSKYKSPHEDVKFRTAYGNPHDVYDFMNDMYLERGSEGEVGAAAGDKNPHLDGKWTDVTGKQSFEEPNAINGSSDKMIPDKGDEGPAQVNHSIEIETNGDSVMLDREHHEEPCDASQEPSTCDDVPAFALTPNKSVSKAGALESVNRALPSGESILATKGIPSAKGTESLVTSGKEKSWKIPGVEPDTDSDSDSIPNIVDADPDTDSDAE